MSTYNDASLIYYPSGYKESKAYSLKPTDGSGDLTFTRASTATRVNESGLIEEVAANVPRLDNSQGGCSTLLLEPQRTNLIKNSNPTTIESASNGITFESFSWSIGFTNCVKWTNINNSYWYGGTVLPSTIYTISAYIIMDDLSQPNVGAGVGNDFFMVVGNATVTSYSYENMGNNEWLVYGSITSSTINLNNSGIRKLSNSSKGFRATGFQVELGSYPTSYIPTSGVAVTRVKDASITTGLSSVINSVEGVLYAEIASINNDTDFKLLSLSDGSTSNRIYVGFTITGTPNNIGVVVSVSGVSQVSINYAITNALQLNKVAFKYKLNNFALWVNGIEAAIDTSGITFPINTLNNFSFSSGSGGAAFFGNVQNVMIFPTVLSDAELETLTTL